MSKRRSTFAERLVTLRQERGLSRQRLADAIDGNSSQVRRYETGETLPAFEVIRRLAIVLNVSADDLLFSDEERGSQDDLHSSLVAVQRLSADERKLAREFLDALVVKHRVSQARPRRDDARVTRGR